jgi:hypothetical protein
MLRALLRRGAAAVAGALQAEYGDVVLNRHSDKQGVRPVVFPHWFHRIRFRCKVCHQELGFKMRAGSQRRADERHHRRQVLRHVPQRADRLGPRALRPVPLRPAGLPAASSAARRPPGRGGGRAHAAPPLLLPSSAWWAGRPAPAAPVAHGPSRPGPAGAATPWRTCMGGFLAPALPGRRAAPAMPRRAAACLRALLSPGGDGAARQRPAGGRPAGGRLWRADLGFNTLTAMAGAPAGPWHGAGARARPVGLGARPARRARCCASRATGACCRPGAPARRAVSPVAMALADGGATLLLADGLCAMVRAAGPRRAWRSRAARAATARVSGVDALAPWPATACSCSTAWPAWCTASRATAACSTATLGGGELCSRWRWPPTASAASSCSTRGPQHQACCCGPAAPARARRRRAGRAADRRPGGRRAPAGVSDPLPGRW